MRAALEVTPPVLFFPWLERLDATPASPELGDELCAEFDDDDPPITPPITELAAPPSTEVTAPPTSDVIAACALAAAMKPRTIAEYFILR